MKSSQIQWRKATASVSDGFCVEVGAWRKSHASFSNGNCVEAGVWNKSSVSTSSQNCVEAGAWNKAKASYGSGGNCVETTAESNVILVRDTKISREIGDKAPVQSFTLRGWQKVVVAIKAGKLDGYTDKICNIKLGNGQKLEIRPAGDGMTEWRVSGQDVVHRYTAGEMHAFIDGVQAGEFDLAPELSLQLATA